MEFMILVILCSWVYKTLFVKEEARPLSNEQMDVLHGGE